MTFQPIDSNEVWTGKVVSVRRVRVRYDDGEEAEREVVHHPGAVAILAHDGKCLYLVAHEREAVGEQALLELPAGKLDHDGEEPLDTAKRELAEEIGKGARNWKHLTTCYTSPGFTDEKVHVYLATDLYDEHVEEEQKERMEPRTVPLADLDRLIEDCHDAKSLIGLLWLKAYELR